MSACCLPSSAVFLLCAVLSSATYSDWDVDKMPEKTADFWRDALDNWGAPLTHHATPFYKWSVYWQDAFLEDKLRALKQTRLHQETECLRIAFTGTSAECILPLVTVIAQFTRSPVGWIRVSGCPRQDGLNGLNGLCAPHDLNGLYPPMNREQTSRADPRIFYSRYLGARHKGWKHKGGMLTAITEDDTAVFKRHEYNPAKTIRPVNGQVPGDLDVHANLYPDYAYQHDTVIGWVKPWIRGGSYVFDAPPGLAAPQMRVELE